MTRNPQRLPLIASDAGEGHVTVLPAACAPSVTAGTWAIVVHNSAAFGYFDNSAAIAQNDQFDFPIYLPVGTYTVTIMGNQGTNLAKAHLLIDGADKGNVDFYAAAPAFNYQGSITGISVTTAGLKTASIKATDKNASSTDYYLAIQAIVFKRTA